MKKIYAVLGCILLVGMLSVGIWSLLDKDATFSARENRALKTKPALTFSSLLDGSYAEDYRAYYADTFPNREGLLKTNRSLNGFYYFSGLTSKDGVQLVVNFQNGAADHGEALKPPDSSATGDSAEPTEPSGDTAGEPAEPSEPSAATEATEPTPPAEQVGTVILAGNRAMEVAYADYDSIESYANAVTEIAAALGSQVRTFSIAVPNSAEFYTQEEYHTGSSSQKDMIDFCYDHLGSNVTAVDAYKALSEHTGEYIYFRTDHHWTQLGAYYAYTAFCEAAGLTAEPLSKFESGDRGDFLGSMYTAISDYPASQVLRDDPDTLQFWRPYVDLDTKWYPDATLSEPYATGTICQVGDDTSNKYLTFLGGDHPVTIIQTNVDGPVCLLLKESYGNAFAPWLTSHYSKVIVVDPREFNRDGKPSLDLAAFAQQQGVDDCIILNYPMMLNSDSYIAWLARMVE